MYKKVLIASDLSDTEKKDIKQFLSLLDPEKTELHLIHIIEPIPSYAYGLSPYTEIGAEGLDEAHSAMAKLGRYLKVPKANQHVATGHAKRTILEHASKEKFDLIVVASHGKQGLARLLGSTANAIANHAACDVMIIRQPH